MRGSVRGQNAGRITIKSFTSGATGNPRGRRGARVQGGRVRREQKSVLELLQKSLDELEKRSPRDMDVPE